MKADLHVHSDHSSDGSSSIEELLAAADAMGIGCIAFTDHNTMNGYYEAVEMGYGIIIVPAMEISSAKGHILAYGLSEEVPPGLEVKETIDAIHAVGGIAVAAHPYRVWSGLGEVNVCKDFDAIEVMNGRSDKKGNQSAAALADRLGKPVTAGSDAHSVRQLGSALSIISDTCCDADEVIRAVLECRISVSGHSRSPMGSVRYAFKAVKEYIGRGFLRM
ncbi:MAG: hypothetical protein PWQ88_280 [Candidatus Methanomethylophilaceae archaeon]|nr:hypothetical protein [Candidatus Methanomethylophilaceae archaeon]MDI3542036.1 hypothetical protein [Candidatus Methanomethylophilaceae archaeon]HIJ00256.1 CehA/McbA family metallohydrolase [Candidatus Methanomethylophilaceae archaeon]